MLIIFLFVHVFYPIMGSTLIDIKVHILLHADILLFVLVNACMHYVFNVHVLS